MEKKTICFITEWYPTEENPYQGRFFLEQSLAMKDSYDFIVLHYKFENTKFFRHYNVTKSLSYDNVLEWQVTVYAPTLINRLKEFAFRKQNQTEADMVELFSEVIDKEIKHNFDVLYCVSGQREAGYMKALSEKYHKPYVVSEHGPVPWQGSFLSNYHKAGIEGANQLLAISYDKLKQLMTQGVCLPNVSYVGNLVDEDIFTRKSKEHEVKTFVAVGANVFYKNYPHLIKVFNYLTKICDVPFKIMIVGYAANKGYSTEPDALEKQLKNSAFIDSVIFAPEVERSKMHDIFEQADAFVMTSVQEGMPVSALEAACCGLPIFSTRCGGVEDYVSDDIGRIYDIFDVESFAEGLKNYLEGNMVFDANYIREYIISRFGKAAFVNHMVSAFDKAINE